MDNPNPEKIREKYNEMDEIWPEDDKWHRYTRSIIFPYVQKFIRDTYATGAGILNAGSGGSDYGLSEYSMMTHLDIAEKKIEMFPHYIVGGIEKIEASDNRFDACICVGSVLNYCTDAVKAIQEISRVLKPGASLLLEFETTNDLELLFSKKINSSTQPLQTFYAGEPETIWIYDSKYIKEHLNQNHFIIKDSLPFHIFSPLALKFFKKTNFASKFARLDNVARRIPLLKMYGSNVLLRAQKIL